MQKKFSNYNLSFSLGGLRYYVSNIVFEQFRRTIPMHSHSKDSFEIHYIPFGYGYARIDGQDYEIVPNTLYVTGPFVEHEQVPRKDDPMSEYCIYLKADHSRTSYKALPADSPIRAFEKTFFWFGQDTQDIHTMMKQLFFELEHMYSGYAIQAESLLLQLIVKLVRNYEDKKETRLAAGFPDLADNKFIMVDTCFLYEYQDLTLEKLAARMGLGIRQTERLLKEHYNKTFLQKKTEARMSAASILLRDRQKSITDISVELGYSSVEHFSAAFKRYYKQSASAYRKNLF